MTRMSPSEYVNRAGALPSRARLSELLEYDVQTGVFTWKAPTTHRVRVGQVAGALSKNGYRTIGIDGTTYLAHRLAWLYVEGVPPPQLIDHINGERDDNRIVNLRLANKVQNALNARRPITNTSGYKGVSFHKGARKWAASITAEGKQRYLGLFTTPEAAHEAYISAATQVDAQFARAG